MTKWISQLVCQQWTLVLVLTLTLTILTQCLEHFPTGKELPQCSDLQKTLKGEFWHCWSFVWVFLYSWSLNFRFVQEIWESYIYSLFVCMFHCISRKNCIYMYISKYIYIYMYVYIHIYATMKSWKRCALLVIITMAL